MEPQMDTDKHRYKETYLCLSVSICGSLFFPCSPCLRGEETVSESRAFDDGEDFGFAQDEEFLAVDFGHDAGVAVEEHPVAVVDGQFDASPVLQTASVAHRQDAALFGFLSGLFGQDDAAGGRLFRFETPDNDFVAQGH